MNRTFIYVLLLIIAAAAIYFVFFNKSKPPIVAHNNKDLIIGKWKIDSIQINSDTTKLLPAAFELYIDTNLKKNIFDLQKDGNIFHTQVGNNITDTLKYNWNTDSTFTWINLKKEPGNSMVEILKLNNDTLLLKTSDSSFFQFVKQK